MSTDHDPPVWWWDKIWKERVPNKAKTFMWLALHNKVLTWEAKKKRNVHGPGICALCFGTEETTTHIFVECIYINRCGRI